MFNELVKKNLFKVKKIKIRDQFIQGVVLPFFDHYNSRFDDGRVVFLTNNGTRYEFGIERYEIMTTKVTNEKLKKVYDNIILEEKKKYKLYLEIIKLKESQKKVELQINKIDDKTKKLSNDIIKAQGFICECDFRNILHKEINGLNNDYIIDVDINSKKIININLRKNVELERWVKASEYDFLYEEYDGNILAVDDLENSRHLKSLSDKYFNKINVKKIGNYTIDGKLEPYVGDKRTLYLMHIIDMNLKKGIELKKENIKDIMKLIGDFVKII